jgi:hypothetical protein
MYIRIIICTIHYIMTFAFINIHLDIYRIIIIIPYRKRADASTMRKNFGERGNFYASLCMKRREGVFRLRLKNEISTTPKHFIHGRKSKIILQSKTQITSYYLWSFVLLLCSCSFGLVNLYESIVSQIQKFKGKGKNKV